MCAKSISWVKPRESSRIRNSVAKLSLSESTCMLKSPNSTKEEHRVVMSSVRNPVLGLNQTAQSNPGLRMGQTVQSETLG
jgi:hypothetical protein